MDSKRAFVSVKACVLALVGVSLNQMLVAATVAAGLVFVVSAKTIYVDDDNYGKGGTGSAENPYGTIQEAVAAASTTEMDTVQVAVGTYNQGETLVSGSRYNRVNIDRKVKIVGAGQDKTFVVGSRDASHPVGGFYIAAAGHGSKIESLTVADCEVPKDSEYGGGFSTTKDDATTNVYMVAYCTVTNCAALRGGAMRSGFAFSCRFFGNSASIGGSLYRASAYNCVLSDSTAPTAGGAYDYGWLVNCTVINNGGDRGIQVSEGWRDSQPGYGRVWNSVSVSNKLANNDGSGIYTNSVLDATNSTYYDPRSEDVTLLVHGSNANSTKFTTNVVINLIKGDFAPVKGGYLDAKGVRDYLSLDIIPPEYQGRGFDGELWTGDVPIGALIAAKEAKTAPIVFVNPVRIYGKESLMNYTAIYSDVWPRQVYVEPRASQAEKCVAFSYGNLVTDRRYLGLKKGVWVLFPPKFEADGETPVKHLTVSSSVAAQVLWVDDDAEFEGDADGTEGKPYRTIQAACDVVGAAATSVQTLIKVKPGVYSNGVAVSTYSSAKARVVLPASRDIQIVSVEGPEKTFVTGEPDPVTGGVGSDSVRCFASPNNTSLCIAGFTLMEGYTSTGDVSGGAVRGGGANQQVWDCVFTRNHSLQTGACVNQAPTYRCLFTNNVDNTHGCHINIGATSCIFANNATASHNYMPLYNSCFAYGCTIYEPEASKDCYIWNSNIKAFNTVVVAAGRTTSVKQNNGVLAGNVLGDIKSYDGTFIDEQQLHTNPFVAYPATLDFRLTEISPALTAGRCVNAPATTTASATAFTAANFVQYMIGDYYGNPQVMEDGTVRAGAVTTVKPAANVYADAENGSDDNDGSDEQKAKKTLTAAVAAAAPGDTVVALPGDYKQGEATISVYDSVLKEDAEIRARVRVPNGLTLKSRDGAEATAIYGAKSPTGRTIPELEGCGEGALRCAIVDAGGTLEGFTLREGRTSDTASNWQEAYGACVYGLDRERSVVKNCILTDNIGGRGACGTTVTFDHCILTNNIAFTFASAGIFCNAYNCYFNDLWGSRTMDYYREVVNCTVGRYVGNTNRTAVHTFLDPHGENPKIWNLLSLCDVSAYSMDLSGASVKNCVFPSNGAANTYDADAENIITNRTRAQLFLDYDEMGRSNAVTANAVDAGRETELAGATDLGGGTRILNRQIDIGCWEADWRATYGEKLGKNVTVVAASSHARATAAGDGISLANGDALDIKWASGKITGYGRINFTLGEGASLLVTVNGVATELTGGTSFDFISSLTEQSVVLTAHGGDVTVAGLKRFNGMTVIVK